MSHDALEQLKWVYSSLSGICLAVILTTLTLESSVIDDSLTLQIAIGLFVIALIIFSCFTIVHIAISGEKTSDDINGIEDNLSIPWVKLLTSCAFMILYYAFFFLISHINIFFGVTYAVTSLLLLPLTNYFLKKFNVELQFFN
ncbi:MULTISPECIES: hypothetical protein [Aeromonas]|uniref:hypothetical protein n=1 Tax=Aeromonas TaxID=642 RepID=UPI0012FF23AD|nr:MULTISPECIES: hypothetical protein [Aeromonas]QXA15882.1 hypothetical protein I6L33_01355 [Aeromonas sp. FDAARGOS 1403]